VILVPAHQGSFEDSIYFRAGSLELEQLQRESHSGCSKSRMDFCSNFDSGFVHFQKNTNEKYNELEMSCSMKSQDLRGRERASGTF